MELSENKRKKNYKNFVQDYYNLITRGYREIWGSDHFHCHIWKEGQTKSQALEFYHEYIFKKLNMPSSSIVADYGCGIGAFSFLLSQKFTHVTAINFHKKQLKIARRTAKQKGIKNVDFIEADIMETHYDNMFDVIFLIDVDPCLPNKKKMLRIVSKALKPGGKIVLAAWCKPSKISVAAEHLIIQPFNATWGLPYQETPENYLKHFKKLNLNLVYYEDLTKSVKKSVHQGYIDFLQKVNTSKLIDISKVLDLSMIKYPYKIWEKAHEATQMVLYSQAAYDAGLFLYPFYILQKK